MSMNVKIEIDTLSRLEWSGIGALDKREMFGARTLADLRVKS